MALVSLGLLSPSLSVGLQRAANTGAAATQAQGMSGAQVAAEQLTNASDGTWFFVFGGPQIANFGAGPPRLQLASFQDSDFFGQINRSVVERVPSGGQWLDRYQKTNGSHIDASGTVAAPGAPITVAVTMVAGINVAIYVSVVGGAFDATPRVSGTPVAAWNLATIAMNSAGSNCAPYWCAGAVRFATALSTAALGQLHDAVV